MTVNNRESPQRLVIGMSGASGAPLCIELLRAMRAFPEWETHLVISEGAQRTIELETDLSMAEMTALATQCHPLDDVAASISSGTFKTAGMVVVPCSMKTLAGIAHGFSENLLLRAADVVIKERRRLVLVTREVPLSPIHLANMLTLSQLGAVILPPMLSFYNRPQTILDMTHHIVGKILDCFGLDAACFRRWCGPQKAP
jgi:polyprenyl P-hydroxybenzoate/phenylacrylic acid decarboxylase-like protein